MHVIKMIYLEFRNVSNFDIPIHLMKQLLQKFAMSHFYEILLFSSQIKAKFQNFVSLIPLKFKLNNLNNIKLPLF